MSAAAMAAMLLVSCSDDDAPKRPNTGGEEDVSDPVMFVLNEGQMGYNNSTIDMLNLTDFSYTQDAYGTANPSVVLELGDTGNDLTIVGDKLYAVINGSHKVEVIDAKNCKNLGSINISSPRYAVAHGDYLYVSSWVGGDNNQGSVVKVDLATNEVVASRGVGIHPEQMAELNGKLYVTSSQDYATGEFDNRLFVIDLSTFEVAEVFEVGTNMTQIQAANSQLYLVSAGNYADIASSIYVVNPTELTYKHLEIPATKLAVSGNNGYVLATTYDENWSATTTISQIDLKTLSVSGLSLDKFDELETPYAIAVDPKDGTLYVSDACDYTTRGYVYAYNPATGERKGKYNAGVLPGHFAFYYK
ncbi:MAG: hypothetical protein K2L81_04815 [Muribaculaceae bacterium]|nr:hypothetical protein [Muribaculaceae bacterium]